MKTETKRYYRKRQGDPIGGKHEIEFVPGVTIACNPPFIKGKLDNGFYMVKGVDSTDKAQAEKAIGLSLLPL